MTGERHNLVSLHGSRAGLSHAGDLLIDEQHVASAPRSTTKPVVLFDDFLGDVIQSPWDSKIGSDGSCVAATINVAANGTARLTSGASGTVTNAVNGSQLQSSLNWYINKGNLVFETRVKLSAITTVSMFCGFTDQTSALEMPITSAASANTITTNATDAIGFFFDTSMTDDNFWISSVNTDVDGVHVNTAIAPVAATYNTLRIEVDILGNASFYIDGNLVGTQALAATVTVALTPVVAFFTRTGSSYTLDVDYILVKQDR